MINSVEIKTETIVICAIVAFIVNHLDFANVGASKAGEVISGPLNCLIRAIFSSEKNVY